MFYENFIQYTHRIPWSLHEVFMFFPRGVPWKSSTDFPWKIFHVNVWNFHGRFFMESFLWHSTKHRSGTFILQDRTETLPDGVIVPPGLPFFPDCLHGPLPAPFLLSYSVFDFDFSLFFVSGPCARLSWPSRQLLSARKSTVSYRIVSYGH